MRHAPGVAPVREPGRSRNNEGSLDGDLGLEVDLSSFGGVKPLTPTLQGRARLGTVIAREGGTPCIWTMATASFD